MRIFVCIVHSSGRWFVIINWSVFHITDTITGLLVTTQHASVTLHHALQENTQRNMPTHTDRQTDRERHLAHEIKHICTMTTQWYKLSVTHVTSTPTHTHRQTNRQTDRHLANEIKHICTMTQWHKLCLWQLSGEAWLLTVSWDSKITWNKYTTNTLYYITQFTQQLYSTLVYIWHFTDLTLPHNMTRLSIVSALYFSTDKKPAQCNRQQYKLKLTTSTIRPWAVRLRSGCLWG